ncbi:type VI secretion system tube protein TssD [Larkinella sp. VNQ87]|uniref:type VI secretion system tube protein TssD n=1 Tax=Larkinella sp. VNQ87 TaxID=3400921 RepID=UPI003C012236
MDATLRAEMEVDNELFILNRFFFTASRKRDKKGKPASGTTWRVYVAMDVMEQGTFASWMFDPNMQKDVTITFFANQNDGQGETKVKTWKLNAVFCFGLLELFIADASFETTNFFFSGKSVSNQKATLEHEDE